MGYSVFWGVVILIMVIFWFWYKCSYVVCIINVEFYKFYVVLQYIKDVLFFVMLEWLVFVIVEGIEEFNYVCIFSMIELCDVFFCYLVVLGMFDGVK